MVFCRIDKDRNGRITADELQQALSNGRTRMSAFQISISSRKLERTPRDPLGTGINEITVKFQNEAPGLIFFRGPF